MGPRGGAGPPTSCSVDGSGRESSGFNGLLSTDGEFCLCIGTGDSWRWEDVDGVGCSLSSPSTSSVARCLPFPFLGATVARAVRPSSVAPNDRAREIRLQLFLDDGVASGRAVELCVVPEEPLGFPTRPIMLRRIEDLRERFGRSDDATAGSSRDGVEAAGGWVDGPALEGGLEALGVFPLDVVCPIPVRVRVDTGSICLRGGGGRDTPGRAGRKVRYGTDEGCGLSVCRGQQRGKGWRV